MTVCVVYVTHGLVNALLLSPWNGAARGSFWDLPQCNSPQDWMLNWLALSSGQTHLLLAGLTYGAIGNPVLEQRLVGVVTALLVASLTAGVFLLPQLNAPMAALQAVIYGVLLVVLVLDQTVVLHGSSNHNNMILSTSQQWRSSSYDARQKMPLSSVALLTQCLVQLLRVIDFTFGSGQEAYVHHSSIDDDDDVYHSISDLALVHMLWVALLLGFAVVGAAREQQRLLLRAHVLALFVSMWMLAGPQGADLVEEQRRSAVVGTFGAIVISVVGSL